MIRVASFALRVLVAAVLLLAGISRIPVRAQEPATAAPKQDAAKPAPGKQDININKDSLKKLIGRFLLLCTDEAAGWHEILWDKNVPLG